MARWAGQSAGAGENAVGRRRWRVRLAVLFVEVLVVSLPLAAWAPSADAVTLRWPSLPVRALRSWLAGPAPAPRVPRQETGTAAGRPQEVPASAARSVAGAVGRTPGMGPGQLPPYVLHRPKAVPYHTGPYVGDGSGSFSLATSTPVPGASTATSALYKNADGSYSRVVYLEPVNYQDSSGAWKPVDTSLVAAPGGGWREKANSLAVSFGPAADSQPFGSLGLAPGGQVSVGLAGAGAVAGALSGMAVAYPGALPDTGVTGSATADGMRISLILHSAAAPAAWTLPLGMTGLAPQLAGGGTVVSFVTPAGSTVAQVTAAYGTDSSVSAASGLPAVSAPVTYQLVSSQGGTGLQVSLDAAWLADPARVFPVTVNLDLSAVVPGTGRAVTQVQAGNLTVAPDGPVVAAGSFGHGTATAAAVLQFPPFPGAAKAWTSAALHVFSAASPVCAPQPLAVSVLAHPAAPGNAGTPGAGTGTPATGTPGTAPGTGTGTGAWRRTGWLASRLCGAGASQPGAAGPAGSWLTSVLPASAVSLAASSGTTVALTAPSPGAASGQLLASAASTDQPFLVVNAASPSGGPQIDGQYPPDNANVTSLVPELIAAGHDPDGDSVQYKFTIYSSSGTQLATSGLISAGNWTVPSGKLAWNQSYFWTVQDYDGTYYSATPAATFLSTPVPQPLITSSLSQNTGGQGFSPQAGNYTTAATDAQVDTVGPALSVERDYNSLDPRTSGAFGAAWSSVLDAKVAPGLNDASGNVETQVVTYPDGQEVGFGKNSDGSYSAPPGRYATLKPVTGGYTLTDKNDTVYTFTQVLGTMPPLSQTFGITSITDALGHALTFTYSTASPPQITQMTSAASGRALHITWSTPANASFPHVASVTTDPATQGVPSSALTWQYSYTGNQLTQVCPPASSTACTAYSYTPGSGFQNAVLDSGPHSYWRLDEGAGSGTAASSVLLNEGADNASYTSVTLGQPGPLGPLRRPRGNGSSGSSGNSGPSAAIT